MAAGTAGDPGTVWTVGHSTRGWEEFLALLAGWGIEAVADVRRFPGSRRYPWFAGDALARALPGACQRWRTSMALKKLRTGALLNMAPWSV